MSDVAYAFTTDLNVGDMFGNLKTNITQGIGSVRDVIVSSWQTIRSAFTTLIDGIKMWWSGIVESRPWLPMVALLAVALTAPVWLPVIPALASRALALIRHMLRLPLVALGIAKR